MPYQRRPDLVLYVNGLALAVIELKRSSVELAEISSVWMSFALQRCLLANAAAARQQRERARGFPGFSYGPM